MRHTGCNLGNGGGERPGHDAGGLGGAQQSDTELAKRQSVTSRIQSAHRSVYIINANAFAALGSTRHSTQTVCMLKGARCILKRAQRLNLQYQDRTLSNPGQDVHDVWWSPPPHQRVSAGVNAGDKGGEDVLGGEHVASEGRSEVRHQRLPHVPR